MVTIRNRLACGIAKDQIRCRLLAESYKDLKLERVVDICTAMYAASKNVQPVQETQPIRSFVCAVFHSCAKKTKA